MNNCEFILGDTGDRELLNLIFKNYKIDAVMHFAEFAYVGESVTEPFKYYDNNFCRALTLLEAMRENKVNKFIFSSTCATYGQPKEIPIVESAEQKPINPYGKSKLMVEQMLEDYSEAYGLNYVALRYFNAAGADPKGRIGEKHNPETYLIPLAIKATYDDTFKLKVFGNDYDTPDGTCIRDYIHVCDLASAHKFAFEYLLSGGKSKKYNLGNGSGYSVHEVINSINKISNKTVKFIDAPRREGDPAKLIGSSKKKI